MAKQSISLQMGQLMKLSPFQIQTLRIYDLSLIELEEKIKQELEENPALEEGAADVDTNDTSTPEDDHDTDTDIDQDDDLTSDRFDDYDPTAYDDYDGSSDYADYQPRDHSNEPERDAFSYTSASDSLYEDLLKQLTLVRGDYSEKILRLAEYVIGNVSSSGLLSRTVEQMVDDYSFTRAEEVTDPEMAQALSIVQSLEPAGIAAADTQECLLLQLQRMPQTETVLHATRIIRDCFDDLANARLSKIQQRLKLTEQQFRDAQHLITHLNPRPYVDEDASATKSAHIIPDCTVLADENGKLQITVQDETLPELHVSSWYADQYDQYASASQHNPSAQEAAAFLRQKLDNARFFIAAIKQRSETLAKVMQIVVDYQREYFLTADHRLLKPLTLKRVAEITGVDNSTICRLVQNKFVETDFGTYPLSHFFASSTSNDEAVSTTVESVQQIVKRMIESEDKSNPISDDEIAVRIKDEEGITMARRTVAKYRDKLGIPVARLRKKS